MQSVNEELQSTNEELETSKEELQSVNEELATVNTELQNKVSELSRANNDMNNLLAGTGIGTVFVDHRLHILRFTPAVTALINLIASDVGRPVATSSPIWWVTTAWWRTSRPYWTPWLPRRWRCRPGEAGGTSCASGPIAPWKT